MPGIIQAQEPTTYPGRITGDVVDADTGEKLPGVNVFLTNTMIGTSTDEAGQFEIEHIPPGSYELVASMIGYTSAGFPISITPEYPHERASFRLKLFVYDLTEVQVQDKEDKSWNRLYEQFKSLFIGSTQRSKGVEIENRYVLNLEQDKRGMLTASAPDAAAHRKPGTGIPGDICADAFSI